VQFDPDLELKSVEMKAEKRKLNKAEERKESGVISIKEYKRAKQAPASMPIDDLFKGSDIGTGVSSW